VNSRNHDNFDEITERALEEKSSIVSKFDRYKSSSTQLSSIKCSNYVKGGHLTSRCYLKGRMSSLINSPIKVELPLLNSRKQYVTIMD
jgi:hypothetical protein